MMFKKEYQNLTSTNVVQLILYLQVIPAVSVKLKKKWMFSKLAIQSKWVDRITGYWDVAVGVVGEKVDLSNTYFVDKIIILPWLCGDFIGNSVVTRNLCRRKRLFLVTGQIHLSRIQIFNFPSDIKTYFKSES
jgi:hypothetical protein